MRHPIRLYWIQHLWTAVPADYHFTITTPAGYYIVMPPLVAVYVSKTSAPDPIKLFTQPKSFKGITGSSYSLNVAVQGTGGSNQYQWYKDGTALTGETSSTLNFSALAESDAGATPLSFLTV